MYTSLKTDDPIRQGDLFRWLPKLELSFGTEELPLLYEQKQLREINWLQWVELIEHDKPLNANVPVSIRPVLGIVISQDCDAGRAENITFCEIKPFSKVEKSFKDKHNNPKDVVDLIPRYTRQHQKWYYLAEGGITGFTQKMGVDFESVFEVRRLMLEKYKDKLRIGRLEDEVAWPHFRERVAEFFRRYPYNEWYPFNSEEVTEYEKSKNISVQRYRWQE